MSEKNATDTAQPTGNVGSDEKLTILAQRSVAPAPALCATRLQIEDNIGEAIHVHWRDLRLDFSIRDFLSLAKGCRAALEKLGHQTLRLNPLASDQVNIPAAFVRDLGPVAQKITAATYEEVALDDLEVVTYVREDGEARWKPQPITESVPYLALATESGEKIYTEYQAQFGSGSRSLAEFRKLLDSMLQHGYPAFDECVILHADEPFIRDGQHRAAILRHFLGNVKIPIIRLSFEAGYEGWRMERRSLASSAKRSAHRQTNADLISRQLEYLAGFHAQEGAFRWASNKAELRLPCQSLLDPTFLSFTLSAGDMWCYRTQAFETSVSLDGQPVELARFERDQQEIEIVVLLEPRDHSVVLTLDSNASFQPCAIDANSQDDRCLAVKLSKLAFVSQPQQAPASSPTVAGCV